MCTGGVKHDCSLCSSSDEYRESHGCDFPTEHPQFSVECPNCQNGCEHCDGGRIYYYECPHKIVSVNDITAVSMFSQLENGVSPVSCGLMEMPNQFVRGYLYFQSIKGKFLEEERKRAEKKAKRQGK